MPDPEQALIAGLHTRGYLPHLKSQGKSYFVTFRLAGTLPKTALLQLKREREQILQQAHAGNRPLTWHEQEQLFKWYSERVDAFLDAGRGECFLSQPDVARCVCKALQFFDGERYELRSWVVMPNHVHVVVHPEASLTLSEVLHSWKSYTATEANKLLHRSGQRFWQRESFDHVIRDDEDSVRCCDYVENNPVKAGFCARAEEWVWGSAHCKAEERLKMLAAGKPRQPAGRDACATGSKV